jgi:hypothetical protein
MKVFTTHTDIPGLAETPELLSMWQESWAKYGWEPVILVPQEHLDLWQALNTASYNLPTCNPRAYQAQCITRWADFRDAGGGLMVDADLINVGLPAEGFTFPAEDDPAIYTTSRDLCPCGVVATPAGILGLIDLILHMSSQPALLASIGDKVSDQEILRWAARHKALPVKALNYAQHYGSPGWENHELIHFGSWPVRQLGGGKTKVQIIEEFLNARGAAPVKENDKL